MNPARPTTSSVPPGCDADLEQIAAFVDGSLTGADRDTLVAHLASCAQCTELVAETAALAGDEAFVAELETTLAQPRGGEIADEPLVQAATASEATADAALNDLPTGRGTPQELADVVTSSPSGDPAAGALDEAHESGALDTPLQPSDGSTSSLDAARAKRREAAEAIRSDAAGAGRWFAIAAGVLALVALGWWLTRSERGVSTGTLIAELETGSALRERLPTNWIDGRWDVMRGGTTVISAPADAAFQLGARSVDLMVALRAEDRDVASAVVARISSVLDAIDLPSALAVPAFQLEQELRVPRQDLAKARDAAESFDAALDSVEPASYVAVGKWAAAAQVAAMTENAAFFDSPAWSQGLDLIGATTASGSLREIAQRLRAAEPSAGDADVFAAVERDVRAVLRLLGDGDASLN